MASVHRATVVGVGKFEEKSADGSKQKYEKRDRLRRLLEDEWLQQRRRDPQVVFELTDDAGIKARLSDGSFLRFNYDEEHIRREGLVKIFWHIVDQIDGAEAEIEAERPNQ